jgi:modulator of FtsH protease
MDLPRPGFIVTLVGFYGLFFLTAKLRNSPFGILSTFALTGFMGYTLGPLIGMFAGAGAMPVVMNALGLTAFVFFGLSAYALTTRKDFNFLAGFLTAGFFVLIGAMILGAFTQIAGLQLMISCGFVLFSSAAILYQTGSIINGGERNYVMATISLYVSIYNIFISLLSILGSSDD